MDSLLSVIQIMIAKHNKQSKQRQSHKILQIFQEEQLQNIDPDQQQIKNEKSQSSFQLQIQEINIDQSSKNYSLGDQQEKKNQIVAYKYEQQEQQNNCKPKIISKKEIRKNIWKEQQERLLLQNVLNFQDQKINWTYIAKKMGKTKIICLMRDYEKLLGNIRKEMQFASITNDQQLITRYLQQKSKKQSQKITINNQKLRQRIDTKGKFYQKQKKIMQNQQKRIKESMLSLQKYLNKTSKKTELKQFTYLKLENLLTQAVQEYENNINSLQKLSVNYQSEIDFIENHKKLYVEDIL